MSPPALPRRLRQNIRPSGYAGVVVHRSLRYAQIRFLYSFEAPSGYSWISLLGNSTFVNGWTTVNNGVEFFNATGYGGAADGVMIVDLANYVYTNGGIKQNFATVVGQTYNVNFSLGSQAASFRDGTAHFDVSVGNVQAGYDIATNSATIVWFPKSLSFTAVGTLTTLQFTNNQNPYAHFAYLDAASVTAAPAVPLPATAWLFGSGLLGLIGVARRRLAI